MEQDHTTVEKLNITMEEVVKPTLQRIEDKVTKTNGSVRDLQKWKSFISGGLAVITVLLLPIIFMVVQNYLDTVSNKELIQNLQANVIKAK